MIMKRIMFTLLIVFCVATLACAESVEELLSRYRNDPQGMSAWMRNNLKYEKERNDYHQRPYETTKRKSGDCEDYAILARRAIGKGKIHCVQNKNGTRHAFLIVEEKNKKYMLSNGRIKEFALNTSVREIARKEWRGGRLIPFDEKKGFKDAKRKRYTSVDKTRRRYWEYLADAAIKRGKPNREYENMAKRFGSKKYKDK